MNKYLFSLFLLLAISFSGIAQSVFEVNDLKKHLEVLASEEFEGREAGRPGAEKAANYIRGEFKKAGLVLLGNDGIQKFSFQGGRKMGGKTSLKVKGYTSKAGIEYASYVYTPGANTKSKVVFVGYGMENEFHNDYHDVDVKGKWVLIITGKPAAERFNSRSLSENKKIDNARKKGAKGVIFVDPSHRNPKDTIIPEQLTTIFFDMPVVQIKRTLCDSFLVGNELAIDAAIALYAKADTVLSRELKADFSYKSDIVPSEFIGRNVVGILKGSDSKLRNEFVVIGGHLDHLGLRSKGSTVDIYRGADDNASGATAVIELAKQMAQLKEKPKRTIVFVSFDAEEKGLLGSDYFIKNLPREITMPKIVAMINLDMIGRYTDKEGLVVIGSNSSKEGEFIVNSLQSTTTLKLSLDSELFANSDHASFHKNNIPVFFLFTGLHKDYHKPTDTPDKINYEKMSEIVSFTERLALELANRPTALEFKTK